MVEPVFSHQFIIIWIANFFVVASLSSFSLFPLFITAHNGRKADIGILMAALALSSVIARPWVSQMVDGFGRKKSYLLGTVILIVVPAVHILFQGNLADFFIPLFLVRVVHGLGVSFAFTASTTFVADIVPKERLNEGMGIFGITALVAMAAGPAISEPIIRHFGFDAYFLTASFFGTSSLVLQLFLRETLIMTASQGQTASFFSVLKRKKVLGVAILALFFGIAMATQMGFVSPYVQSIGLTHISMFFIAYSGMAVLTRILGGKLADRIGEERIIPWAFVVTGLGFLSLMALTNNWMLIGSGLICGCGHGFIFPCLSALAVRDEPIEIRGKIAGIFTGGMDSGLFVGSICLGYVGEWFGYRTIFFTTFVVLI
ncbi:MAG: MFS transporter, partial [Proteobacteria bacterium]|nr:MFS transporter [Pseudomonadota bacterium]